MTGTFERDGSLDTSRGIIATCIGKKRSGKSIMGLLLFWSYPYDRVVIDVAGDDGPMGPDVVQLHGTVADLPRRWPEDKRPEAVNGVEQPMTLRYVPDPGSPTFLADMDCIVGLAMAQGRKTGHAAVLVHEMAVLAPANRTPPHTRRLLMHNRHNHVTAVFCMPRPQTADPLVLLQSDLLYIFDTPNPSDRRRVADTVNWDPADLDDAVGDLGPHEYLRFDANEVKPDGDDPDLRLIHCPALPADDVAAVKRWATGTPANVLHDNEPPRAARASSSSARHSR